MAEQQGNVYAPTEVRVDDVVAAGDLDLATRGSRFLAVLLDGLMAGGIGILAAIMIPMMAKGEGTGMIVGVAVIGLATLGLIGANFYYVWLNGQTLGKKAMGIKVVRTSGERAGLARIFFLRYLPVTLVGAIPYVGIIVTLTDALLIFRESRQCLHDNIADTIVIKA